MLVRRWGALCEKDSFYLVAIEVLCVPSYPYFYLHAANRNQISLQNRSVPQLDGIVCSTAQFIADTPARSIVGGDFQWKFTRVETFLRKTKYVFSNCGQPSRIQAEERIGHAPMCVGSHAIRPPRDVMSRGVYKRSQ